MLITIQDLEKVYRTTEVQTTALDGLSFTVHEGEFVVIIGPSGCGKSTLLNILGFLDRQERGNFVFNGVQVDELKENMRATIRKRNIGFIFQNFNLIEELNVYENVELPLSYSGIKLAERERRVHEVLKKLGILHRRNHFPSQLSGGQQQRVAVARAIIHRPKLILADEPTGNLDSLNRQEVMDLLVDLNREGITVIMVTHSEHDARYGDRIIRLVDGRQVEKWNLD